MNQQHAYGAPEVECLADPSSIPLCMSTVAIKIDSVLISKK